VLFGIQAKNHETRSYITIALTLRLRPSLGPWALRRRLCSSVCHSQAQNVTPKSQHSARSRCSHRVYSCFPIRIRIWWVAVWGAAALAFWQPGMFIFMGLGDGDGVGGVSAVEQLHSWKSKARRRPLYGSMALPVLCVLTVADWSEYPSASSFRRALQRFLITNWILLVCLRPALIYDFSTKIQKPQLELGFCRLPLIKTKCQYDLCSPHTRRYN